MRDELLHRQIGFELLSVFKGATTESIDDAVERILSLEASHHADLIETLRKVRTLTGVKKHASAMIHLDRALAKFGGEVR